ncbi:VWD domain-containing protein [Nannocystis sp. ILAH1]|uniref:VWD domain-containing protein n=1 Tax=Nannocystis sp. ILAH1 TaxID=2996789 RepID=UPI00226D7CC1|nr:VWD domain-containing protein [Nannocystis sp. ILAH1]MCY0991148.1 VWD domain-containing protein [Nannocystis sp. ILAH1]
MRKRHLILTSLSLAGLHGCEAAEPRPEAEAAAPRNVSLWDPPLESCLTDTKISFFHTDGTTDFTDAVSQGLEQFARPGDIVELSYAVTPGCLADHGPRVTLASYTTPGITMQSLVPVQPPQAYDVHTTRVDGGGAGGPLLVRLPDCFFHVALAFGEPLPVLSAPHTYEAEKRLIASTQGGKAGCGDVPTLAVDAFDTVERGWGDAPLVTHFGWNILAGKGTGDLTCELDFEGDGLVDEILNPCPTSTGDIKVDGLPVHTFDQLGEHRPELVVSEGGRRLWAGTTVLANHLDYKPDVRFPEQHPNFVAAKLTPAEAPTLSLLELKYSTMKGMPSIQAGDVVVGQQGAGYMLRVVKRFQSGSSLTLYGHPVGLDETIAGGYFGVRDVPISTADAYCVGDCIGTITPVTAPPGGIFATKKALALDAATLQKGGEEDKLGIKITIPLAEGTSPGTASEAEVFAGIVVKKFSVDGLVFGDLRVDIDVAPTIEASVSVKAEIADSLHLGDIILGGLPTPIPVTLHMRPRIDFAMAFKWAGKFTAAAPFQLTHDEKGWNHKFAPQISGDADLLETGLGMEFALESKFTLVDELGFALGFLYGPHVAPFGALGLKATVDPGTCKLCVAVFGEVGGEFGWDAPWGLGTLLEPLVVTLGEREFKKRCEEYNDECDDPQPPGGPGGTWGDVHVISHDGLLFDFQAGGEFVLVRATAGAPLEIQARQAPLGQNLSLSYNTAAAAKIGDQRVSFHADMPAEVYVDGKVELLEPGVPVAVGGGVLQLAGDRYLLDWPGGDRLSVRVFADHLDLQVALAPARAGAVEGVLGDADGDRSNDIGLGGGVFLAQPVGFEALYRGPGSFSEAWRVPQGQSLFVYAPDTGPQTYRDAPYGLMPVSTPPPNPEDIELAEAECHECPAALRDTCMLDVAFTGDPAFADACHEVAPTPAETMYPADDYVALAPRYGAAIDCADEKVVFRGPDLATADQYPEGKDLTVRVEAGFNYDSGFFGIDWLDTTSPPAGPGTPASDWGARFDCVAIGDDGYGECSLQLDPTDSPCNNPIAFTLFRFAVQEVVPPPEQAELHDVAYFTTPSDE